jgi:hypothetical protein
MKALFLALALVVSAGSAYAANQVEVFRGVTFTANGDLDNSTDVSLRAAVTGIRHCVTSISVASLDTDADAIVRLLSNDTVIWQWGIDGTLSIGTNASFLIPVCTVAGEALEIDLSSDPADNLITYSVNGYTE